MNLRKLTAALALVASAPAMAATCTDTFSLGTLGSSDPTFFGHQFGQAQSFNDCYNFSLPDVANAMGVTLQWDLSSRLAIDVEAVTLLLNGTSVGTRDVTSDLFFFTFNGLQAGSYQLQLAGDVTSTSERGWGNVGYAGGIAAPVPEPETYAMFLLGAGALGLSLRRRK